MKCSQCGAVHIVNNHPEQIPAGWDWALVPGGEPDPVCEKCAPGLGLKGLTPEEADEYNAPHIAASQPQ